MESQKFEHFSKRPLHKPIQVDDVMIQTSISPIKLAAGTNDGRPVIAPIVLDHFTKHWLWQRDGHLHRSELG